MTSQEWKAKLDDMSCNREVGILIDTLVLVDILAKLEELTEPKVAFIPAKETRHVQHKTEA